MVGNTAEITELALVVVELGAIVGTAGMASIGFKLSILTTGRIKPIQIKCAIADGGKKKRKEGRL